MIMRATTIGAVVGVAALTTTACQVDLDLGEVVTREFDVTEFDEIEVDSAFDVFIEVGDEPSVEIDVHEEVEDRLRVDQDGDRLSIGFDGGFLSTSGDLEVRITTPSLTSVDFDGAVDAEITGIDAERFEVDLDGASRVDGRGSVGVLVIDADGASRADFDAVTADRAEVDLDGASRVDVAGADRVEGSAGGASSVSVSDEASVNVRTSGAASID